MDVPSSRMNWNHDAAGTTPANNRRRQPNARRGGLSPIFMEGGTMLVLTRKESESIVISGPARVTIVRIKGGRIRIGVEAEGTTRVVRAELVEEERKDAA